MRKTMFLMISTFFTLLTGQLYSQNVNINITLSDVRSFTVSQPASLNVTFDNEARYTNGVTALAIDHISVVSSKAYVVKVIAGTISGAAGLDPGTVKLTSSIGNSNTGNASGISYASDIALPLSGSTPATVITATSATWSGVHSTTKFNISYQIGANGVYAGKATGLNVIPVTYTVTQP